MYGQGSSIEGRDDADGAGAGMVLIGLGSNQGDSLHIITKAIGQLADFAAGAVHRSSLWRTSPVDCPEGSAEFVNAAVAFAPVTDLTPERLLRELKSLESASGRIADAPRNAPRALDLDLLLFADEIRNSADFTLPHPRAVDRLFVLAPAAEVAPELEWPGTGKTITQLLSALVSDEQVERIDETSRG